MTVLLRRAGILAALTSLGLQACGFHLRGTDTLAIPPELATMRLTMRQGGAYPPLLTEIRNALQAYGHVQVTDDISVAVPVLNVELESLGSEVLAYDSLGRVSAYNLNYRVVYSLTAADGKPWLQAQTLRLQRESTFSRLQVLPSEKQSDYLQTEMRRDIAQQILRQLASLRKPVEGGDRAVAP